MKLSYYAIMLLSVFAYSKPKMTQKSIIKYKKNNKLVTEEIKKSEANKGDHKFEIAAKSNTRGEYSNCIHHKKILITNTLVPKYQYIYNGMYITCENSLSGIINALNSNITTSVFNPTVKFNTSKYAIQYSSASKMINEMMFIAIPEFGSNKHNPGVTGIKECGTGLIATTPDMDINFVLIKEGGFVGIKSNNISDNLDCDTRIATGIILINSSIDSYFTSIQFKWDTITKNTIKYGIKLSKDGLLTYGEGSAMCCNNNKITYYIGYQLPEDYRHFFADCDIINTLTLAHIKNTDYGDLAFEFGVKGLATKHRNIGQVFCGITISNLIRSN